MKVKWSGGRACFPFSFYIFCSSSAPENPKRVSPAALTRPFTRFILPYVALMAPCSCGDRAMSDYKSINATN